jgi:hypothetical protein
VLPSLLIRIHTLDGFVSLFPVSAGFAAVWLDGRETAGGADHDHHSEPGAGAMALRECARFDGNLAEQLSSTSGSAIAARPRLRSRIAASWWPVAIVRLMKCDISVAHLVGNEWEPLPGPKAITGRSMDVR